MAGLIGGPALAKSFRTIAAIALCAALPSSAAALAKTPVAVSSDGPSPSTNAAAVPGPPTGAAMSCSVAATPVTAGAARTQCVSDWSLAELWLVVLYITILASLVAIYPIVFYVGQVWKSRQRGIFDTLSPQAKGQYLAQYHSSEGSPGANDGQIEAEFNTVYNRWFGRRRLLMPAWIIGFIVVTYALIFAIVAVEGLFGLDPSGGRLPFANHRIAVAAISGAYVLVSLDTIARVTRRDLLPEDLYLTALRLAACVPLGYAFASIVGDSSRAPFIALALTAFPLQQLAAFLQQLFTKQFGLTTASPINAQDVPAMLSGVDQAVCERLSAIGINTITQIAYSDPVQLTMRTSLGFLFVLDMVSQALAWIYLESRLNKIRASALRGAFELATFKGDYDAGKPTALALMAQLPALLDMTLPEIMNVLEQIDNDPHVQFLLVAYS